VGGKIAVSRCLVELELRIVHWFLLRPRQQ
jgi:hypothetical protein